MVTRIAVASGKGGTGKTTIATSLALSLALDHGGAGPMREPPLFLDCDVEAPNAHLFLAPELTRREQVAILIPEVDETQCTYCGRCAEVCQYHAIAVLGKKVLVFPQLCHGCGSCHRQCPEGAITEVPSAVGVMEAGSAREGIAFGRGVLNVGEPMAGPVIRKLKRWLQPGDHQVVILDAPPGTACPVVEAIRGASYLILVTEPTPFGLHDLRLAAQVAQELGIASGVIINRDGVGDAGVEAFCLAEGVPILMRIPYERAIAEGTAKGAALVDIHPECVPAFRRLFEQVAERAR
jgi:MinD superfamily P-loop ATPase